MYVRLVCQTVSTTSPRDDKKVPEKFPTKAWSMTAKSISMGCIKSQGAAAVAAGPGQTRRRSNEQRGPGARCMGGALYLWLGCTPERD
jgi:hypothetical protein